MTKVPRTVLMQKKRRLAADQDAHLDYKDQEQSTLDYDAAVKIESPGMDEFEERPAVLLGELGELFVHRF